METLASATGASLGSRAGIAVAVQRLDIVLRLSDSLDLEMPSHGFIVLPEIGDRRAQYERQVGQPTPLEIADEFLWYLRDTLLWIPSDNPSNPTEWSGHGLNWYGPTAISAEGAATLRRVCERWAELFACGPPSFELAIVDTAEPLMASHDRDVLVALLRGLADLARQASSKEHWLLHLGI